MKKIHWISLFAVALACLSIFLRPHFLKAQSGWYYYAQPGDSLFTIGRKVGLSVNELRSSNGIWTDLLHANQKIFIPAATDAASQSYSRSGNDTELLAHLVMAEAGTESFTGQVAAGAVVLNRVNSPLFPKTVAGVIYEPDAFESVSNGIIDNHPTDTARQAAESALSGWDPSGGALFFFNPSKTSSPFIWSREIITQIGDHIFAR